MASQQRPPPGLAGWVGGALHPYVPGDVRRDAASLLAAAAGRAGDVAAARVPPPGHRHLPGRGVLEDDAQKTYEELLARGVEVTDVPTERPYGIDFGLRDPFGNAIRIGQLSATSPA